MYHLRSIPSMDLPELAPYRTMRRQTHHRRDGIFVAEGPKVVERMLASSFGVTSLLITDDWINSLKPFLDRREEDIPVYVAPKSVLNEMTGYHLFQGVLAIGRIPNPITLEQVLAHGREPYLVVAAEQLASAENMGVLVRNCAAFGAQALIVGETCVSPFLRRAVRNSMGAIFKLPIIESSRLPETLRTLRLRGIECIAAHPHAEQTPLPDSDLTGSCCIVLGSEGYGLSADALKECGRALAIPMSNEIDSLNVGNAGAVFLYEVFRQRRTKTS
jgi:tRNA G18 (ribose-2'-O)-methylase SpoU